MVKCKSFSMWSMSLSQLFGYSPKINFICGKCDSYNEERISMQAIILKRPYVKCKNCNEINYIPIEMNMEE